MESKAINLLNQATYEVEQAGREIYYAMTFLEPNHPARIHLKDALRCLGINSPKDVRLSNSVLSIPYGWWL